MSEVEFEQLLCVVSAAIAPRIEEAALNELPDFPAQQFVKPPQAANDSEIAWPFFPFPDGWNGVC